MTSSLESTDRQNLTVKNGIVQSPFIICCSGRSGSSHLSLMLNSHPLMSCLDEVSFITDLVSDEGDLPDLETFHDHLSTDRGFYSQHLTLNKSLDFQAAANDFLCQRKDPSQMQAIGITAHFDFIRLKRLWPNARFIHLTRDGRDVTYSWLRELELDHSAWFAAQRWQTAEDAWDVLASELEPDEYLELTYEDFVRNVEGTLHRLCEFIGLPYDEKMLDFAEEGSYFQMPDARFIGLWRKHLSPKEIRLAEARLSKQLVSRGYMLSVYPPLKVSNLQVKYLKLREVMLRQWSNLKFFGPWLYSLDLLFRRVLKSTRLHAPVQKQMNKRIDAQLLR
ncbi:MAG: sulfotransferase [Phormidesmis sp.]